MKAVFDWEQLADSIIWVRLTASLTTVGKVFIPTGSSLYCGIYIFPDFEQPFGQWKFNSAEEAKKYVDNVLMQNGYKFIPNHLKILK